MPHLLSTVIWVRGPEDKTRLSRQSRFWSSLPLLNIVLRHNVPSLRIFLLRKVRRRWRQGESQRSLKKSNQQRFSWSVKLQLDLKPLEKQSTLIGSPNGSTLLTVLSSTLRLRPERSLCFGFAQHPELVEGSKEGEHSRFPSLNSFSETSLTSGEICRGKKQKSAAASLAVTSFQELSGKR